MGQAGHDNDQDPDANAVDAAAASRHDGLPSASSGSEADATTSADSATGADSATSADTTDRHAGSSRRQFLARAGLTAAGVAVGGAAGGVIGASIGAAVAGANPKEVGETFAVLPARREPGFDHLVVVMYENRSFDNILGYLYDKGNLPEGQHFDGLNFGDYGNTDPFTGDTISVFPHSGDTDTVMQQPNPDPGETYPHVNTQLYGTIDPPTNAAKSSKDMDPPFNAPKAGTKPKMDGFVKDYVVEHQRHNGEDPTYDQYSMIMGSFTPEMLPVFTTLARSFAVYDNWHCAVPSQTLCNRCFFHASTSHGYVTNGGGPDGIRKWLKPENASPTIFNRLEEAGVEWAVYFDDSQLISLTGLLHAPVLQKYWRKRFRRMSTFYQDVAEGRLPAYSFVEPRLLYDHSDMHPPGGPIKAVEVDGITETSGAISDVRAGDALLHQVYTAIRSSERLDGSNAMNTMLLITFDEHGGTYDHVVPGKAVPPKPPSQQGDTEMDFKFDRIGLRVPAIAISAYTARNTIIHEEMNHAAVIATLSDIHGLKPLTDRDKNARTIQNAVNLRLPRQPGTWPDTHPMYIPPNPEAHVPVPGGSDDRPLSPPGIGLLGLLQAKYPRPGDVRPTTYRQAFELVAERGKGLFGG